MSLTLRSNHYFATKSLQLQTIRMIIGLVTVFLTIRMDGGIYVTK